MTDLNRPNISSVNDDIDDIKRRLRRLEASNGASSTMSGETLEIYDLGGVLAAKLGETDTVTHEAGALFYSATGVPLLRVGRQSDLGGAVCLRGVEGTYGGIGVAVGRVPEAVSMAGALVTGVVVKTGLEEPIFQATSEQLLERPLIPLPTRMADDFYSLTSGTFIPTWRASAQHCLSRYSFIQVVCASDAATTGEIRVVHGAVTAAVQSIPAGSAGTTLTWRWDMDGSLLDTHTFVIEARRTGGAGAIRVYDPIVNLGRPDGTVTTTGI